MVSPTTAAPSRPRAQASSGEAEQNVALLEQAPPLDLWRGFKEAGLLPGSVPIAVRSGGGGSGGSTASL
jgi:hypothetical protein